jgi:hypothetical protein
MDRAGTLIFCEPGISNQLGVDSFLYRVIAVLVD